MAETKASTTKAAPAAKPEAKPRKKPVRKSPALKDFPNRLAWLKAMTEYETQQAEAETTAKVARLDKRIAAKLMAAGEIADDLAKLRAERAALVPADAEDEEIDGMSEDEHLAAEGKG
jgi:hypothetical protein